MNLYEYLVNRSGITTACAAKKAMDAYKRYQAYAQTTDHQGFDPFVFAFVDRGYQAFTFRTDQVVKNKKGELAIVTGWTYTSPHGWLVRVKTAAGEYDSCADDLTPAAFPEGLVEILRGKVHTKVDEAFA